MATVFSPDLHAAKANPAKVDINSATQQELEALPVVGAATAKKIIAGRPYASVSDLSKAGVSAKTIEKITPLVTVGAAPAGRPPRPLPRPPLRRNPLRRPKRLPRPRPGRRWT